MEGGSGELNVERVRIRGCFFTGILGSGAGNQTVRINHCIIEQSSNIGAGLFGTGFENTLYVINAIFFETESQGIKHNGVRRMGHPFIVTRT
ncbi:MAG: hypothetical protein HWD58_01345 [Bacteroidota bacterium]|nr:MAG: hypothetical protein HWD58_01345 [Bacteroidota bacterium]